jgi:adenosylcobinamide kinase/adenosylcobinamide-phosphate guanylyltransferase
MLTLITGGARSGKTRFALSIAGETQPCTYIATAELRDEEMRERARRHRTERGDRWRTIEEPYDIAERVKGMTGVVIVDCLTIWLSNWMLREEREVERQIDELFSAFETAPCHVIAVTNEVGSSIVPDNILARRFRDWSGFMNQRAAASAAGVYLMVCGMPLRVK